MRAARLIFALCLLLTVLLASAMGQEWTEYERAVRAAYVSEVEINGTFGHRLLALDYTPDSVAIACHKVRREIGVEYKVMTPPEKLVIISARNVAKYGDPLGPSIPWLRSRGMTWEQIINASGNAGGRDLKL